MRLNSFELSDSMTAVKREMVVHYSYLVHNDESVLLLGRLVEALS